MQFDRCPRTYLTQNMEEWIVAYKMFKNGFLPNAGGWLQQSSKFIQVMTFLEMEISNHEKEMAVKNGRRQ